MTFSPPEGFVDPSDEQQVAAVLDAVLRTLGVLGVRDLLARMPGSRSEASRPGGMFRRAEPASVWVGPEHQIVLSDPVVHAHVVGGVILARDPLPGGRLPQALARLLVAAIADQASQSEAAVVLTAARESTERLER
ncbi:MAG: hypothetical protein QOF53_4123 [Nocardioidaceae bacterium]|jgi:hypothetical protein|nr:hypothetical protein [Nocardioidaceae bacterium]